MGEYIKRADARRAIMGTVWYHVTRGGRLGNGAPCEESAVYKAADIYAAIKSVPAADVVEVRHGYWESRYNEEYKYRCSLCDGGSDLCSDYCPNCGAIMENKDEEQ